MYIQCSFEISNVTGTEITKELWKKNEKEITSIVVVMIIYQI